MECWDMLGISTWHWIFLRFALRFFDGTIAYSILQPDKVGWRVMGMRLGLGTKDLREPSEFYLQVIRAGFSFTSFSSLRYHQLANWGKGWFCEPHPTSWHEHWRWGTLMGGLCCAPGKMSWHPHGTAARVQRHFCFHHLHEQEGRQRAGRIPLHARLQLLGYGCWNARMSMRW